MALVVAEDDVLRAEYYPRLRVIRYRDKVTGRFIPRPRYVKFYSFLGLDYTEVKEKPVEVECDLYYTVDTRELEEYSIKHDGVDYLTSAEALDYHEVAKEHIEDTIRNYFGGTIFRIGKQREEFRFECFTDEEEREGEIRWRRTKIEPWRKRVEWRAE